METSDQRPDEHPDSTLPQFRANNATTTVDTNVPSSEAAPKDATAVYPQQYANASLDSGIDAGPERVASAGNGGSSQPGESAVMDPQLAEEQNLTPDVRRVPKRRRRRKASCRHIGREQRYDFDLTGARQRFGYRERRVRSPAARVDRGLLARGCVGMLIRSAVRVRRLV